MVKWSIKLSEFSLEYRPRKATKAQALFDFVAECSFYGQPDEARSEEPITKEPLSGDDNNKNQTELEFDVTDHWFVYIDGFLV